MPRLFRRLLQPDLRPWTLFCLALVPILALIVGAVNLWFVEENRIEKSSDDQVSVAEASMIHDMSAALTALQDGAVAHDLGYISAIELAELVDETLDVTDDLNSRVSDRLSHPSRSFTQANAATFERALNDAKALAVALGDGDARGFRGFTLRNSLSRNAFELDQMWNQVEFSVDESAAAAAMQEARLLHNYNSAVLAERQVIMRELSDVTPNVASSRTITDASAVRSAAFANLVAVDASPFKNNAVYAGTDPAAVLGTWAEELMAGTRTNGQDWFLESQTLVRVADDRVDALLGGLSLAKQTEIAAAERDQRTNAILAGGVLLLAFALGLVARSEVRDRQRVERAHAEAIDDLVVRTERDALTGLWNRTRAEELLQERLSEQDEDAPVVLAYVDLDEFKPINDIWGHGIGDEVLRVVASRLLAAVPEGFDVVRFGGDEFVLFGRLANADVPSVSDLGRRVIDEVSRPMVVNGQERSVGATAGLAFATGRTSVSADLLVEADAALILAKQRQRGSALVYDRELRRDATLLRELPDAIDLGHIGAYFQPAYDMHTGQCIAVEALARWTRPSGEMVSPGEFIPLAESFGLMARLTDVMVREVANLQAEGAVPESCRVWVNLSATELDSRHFAERFVQQALGHGVDLSRLGVEITETAAIRNPKNLTVALEILRRSGIHVAIDDFGNGYSPLGFLRQIPFDVLKLDRSIVSHIDSKHDLQILVQGIVGMMHVHNVEIVAEGIERTEEFDWLKSIGVETAQGYLLAKPLPKHELLDMINDPAKTSTSNS